jgi:2-iminobutanoate/2-iminopropanoate deaminase
MKTHRRAVLRKLFTTAAGVAGVAKLAQAAIPAAVEEDINSLIYLSGVGGHEAPFEIKSHTKVVLDGLEGQLKRQGSSMEKCLKAQVWLNDIADFPAMNEIYKGRFGSKPPVRTTVAVAKGGVPGNSIVEIDLIAYK